MMPTQRIRTYRNFSRPQAPAIGRKTVCNPEAIINISDRTERVRYHDGDTGDIIETILWMDQNSRRWINQDAAADCLRGSTTEQTLRNVWSFVRSNVRYQADRPGYEKVQSPGALFTGSRKGDCKSLSIAEAALLRALDIPYKYRFASYETGGDYTHVYVVAKTPKGWVPLDAVYDYPLKEQQYVKKTDLSPRPAINGINADKWIPSPGGTKWNPAPGGTKWTPIPADAKWMPTPDGEVIVTTLPPTPPPPPATDWKIIGLLAFILLFLSKA